MAKRVLVVDEDRLVQQTIGAFLQERGFEASLSMDFAQAEQMAGEEQFAAVLIDACWPSGTGVSRIARIRELQPKTPIIAMSEFSDRELEQEARRLGASFCLTKPLVRDDLLQALEASLQTDVATDVPEVSPDLLGQFLLRGFTPDQQWDFRMTGTIRAYQEGEVIPLNDDSSSMVWVEQGKLKVCVNASLVDTLAEGEFWGEESFLCPGSVVTHLVAQSNVQLRHFSKKKIMDFFAYHDETLTKRYILNLANCLHRKWKRSLARLIAANSRIQEAETCL